MWSKAIESLGERWREVLAWVQQMDRYKQIRPKMLAWVQEMDPYEQWDY